MAAGLRDDLGRREACVVDVSDKGLALRSSTPPRQGSYIEVLTGGEVVVGRVVWVRDGKFGMQSQERLPARLMRLDLSKAAGAPVQFGRRSAPATTIYEQSRDQAQRTEFVWWILVHLAAAIIAYDLVQETFADPLSLVVTALHGGSRG